MTAKSKYGPVVFMTVTPNGPCNMGKSFVPWFLHSILISAFVVHLAA